MKGPLGGVSLGFRFRPPGVPGLFVSVFTATILLGAILQLYLPNPAISTAESSLDI